MKTRIFDFHPAEELTAAETARIDEVVAWYNAAGERGLTANFWIDADTEAALTHTTWVIMRLRMEKRRQLNDPQFCIAAPEPLIDSGFDLLSGLDSRLPRLLFMPRAIKPDEFVNPLGFFDRFSDALQRRMLNWRVVFLCDSPDTQLEPLTYALDAAEGKLETPCIEVPYSTRVADAGVLCDRLSTLWRTVPALADTLGMLNDGYVKRFYQLKELWHLALLEDTALTPSDIRGALGVAAPEADPAAVAAFDAAFLNRHANAANYAAWRANKSSSVLELDLDSIADSHECQSPVFINGQWLVDRGALTHADMPAQLAARPAEPPGPISAST